MPFKLIRLSGSLTDESFPGYICSDTGITVAVSNPADHSIRIYGNGIIPANIAQYNWVAVWQYGNICIPASGRKCGSSKTFLGKYTHTDETDAVITILGKCQNILNVINLKAEDIYS